MTDPWSSWAAGVLERLQAPVASENIDTLWAWSGAESGIDRMRWNNPLNTTQLEGPGNVDANSVGVKIYPTVQQGIAATVVTLLNGRYPLIVDHLRRSVPRARWTDCCGELGTWGTGCGWLTSNYGLPQFSGELEMNLATKEAFVRLAYLAALGREPESQAALDGWANRITDDGSNVNTIVANIADSAEGQQRLAAVKAAITAAPANLVDQQARDAAAAAQQLAQKVESAVKQAGGALASA